MTKFPKPDGPPVSLSRFLAALHGHISNAFIEVRLFADSGNRGVQRVFYASPQELVQDAEHLNKLSAQRNGGVFFGVLPRRERGKGKSEDTLPSRVVWSDIDFKDFGGREEEARRTLKSFAFKPSALVRSGHGLHAYWLLEDLEEPAVLSETSKRVGRMIGGDHTFDAARLLRLPGSFNRKDPDAPLLVEIEDLDEQRVYTLEAIQAVLPAVAQAPAGVRTPAKPVDGELRIDKAQMPRRVLALLDSKPRIKAAFEGRGKAEVGSDGARADTSSSGYDFSVVLRLAQAGVTDPGELATALWHRPDGAAQAKGGSYIDHTVRKALERVEAVEDAVDPREEIDFVVERFRVFTSTPAIFELTIDGQELRLSSSQLMRREGFTTAYLDTLKRLPRLPERKSWPDLVNLWLADAEKLDLPPEASTETALRESIESVVKDLPLGDDVEALDHNKAVKLDDGRTLFKASTVRHKLEEEWPSLPRQVLCRTLTDMGFQSSTHSVGGAKVRGWSRP